MCEIALAAQEQAMASSFRNPDEPLTEDQRLVRKQIFEQVVNLPESFSMSFWDAKLYHPQEDCGTTRCVAGWAIHFSGIDILEICTLQDLTIHGSDKIVEHAIKVMGLTREEYTDGEARLFYTTAADAIERLGNLAA